MTEEARSAIFSRLQAHETLSAADCELELKQLGSAPKSDLSELRDLFLTHLARQTATSTLVGNRSEAVRELSDQVYQWYRNRRVVAGFDSRLAALPWLEGGVLVRFGAATPDERVGVSYARAAIAESGSLVVYCDRSNPASNNWLIADHIVLLNEADLVASYEEVWRHLRETGRNEDDPRGISFISGPSSSSDIRMEKVFAAHGPGRLHVIVLRSGDGDQ